MGYIMNSRHRESITRTVNESIDNLNTFRKCVIIRPSVFNIPMVIRTILNKSKYKHVICLYKNASLASNIRSLNNDGRVTYVSYLRYKDLNIEDFDLVILLDISFIYDTILDIGNNAVSLDIPILGVDTRYNYLDNKDIINDLFDNKRVSDYTLDNAIDDKIMQKPIYVYAMDKEAIGDSVGDTGIDNIYKEYIDNASTVISDTINSAYKNTPSYMRFLVFMSREAYINQRSDEIKNWFIQAFPEHKVNDLIYITSSNKNKHNIKALKTLEKSDKTIDIIISINMLHYSDEPTDITSVIFLRNTRSSNVYVSQFECAMRNDDKLPIIIDFVANINTPSIFYSKSSKSNKNHGKLRLGLSESHVNVIDNTAKLWDIINKINERLEESLAKRIIEDRMSDIAYPVDYLSKKYRVNPYKIAKLLNNHKEILITKRRQLQDRDYFEKGIIGGWRIL